MRSSKEGHTKSAPSCNARRSEQANASELLLSSFAARSFFFSFVLFISHQLGFPERAKSTPSNQSFYSWRSNRGLYRERRTQNQACATPFALSAVLLHNDTVFKATQSVPWTAASVRLAQLAEPLNGSSVGFDGWGDLHHRAQETIAWISKWKASFSYRVN